VNPKLAIPFLAFLVLARAQSPDDPERGKRLYQGHCALCHGITGTGGKGPSLAKPTLQRAANNLQLVEVIVSGIPGTEMPGAWQLTQREAFQVANYVRSLGTVPVVALPGDPARGKSLYDSKGGCAACHIVRGAGRSFGPELSEIGARRNADYLRESLLKPEAAVPDGFLVVSATTRDGKTVRGIRMAEDSFTVQLRDPAGRIHSFRKSDLVDLKKEFKRSPMPSYESTFNAAELDDLIAYLASLRGGS
jgi:cytochrome c oxidase cbb3-type subunit 3